VKSILKQRNAADQKYATLIMLQKLEIIRRLESGVSFIQHWTVKCKYKKHLHANNILVSEQYGFRSKTSTKNAAFKVTDSQLTKKCMLEEFSMIWQRALTV
jgi:ribosome-binding ATPase YchF (GTP1/OBG family)